MSKKKKDSDNIDKWLEHGTDPENNTLLINGDIDEATADRVISAFHLFDPNKPVLVLLNSPGGSCTDGFAIYDTIKAHPSEVTIRVLGEACSMGAVILQAGDIRQVSPRSMVMTHVGSHETGGHVTNVNRALKAGAILGDYMARILVDRVNEKRVKDGETARTLEWWKKYDQFDNFTNAEQTVELGLADEIYEPHK